MSIESQLNASHPENRISHLTAIQYNAAINYNLNPGTGSTSFIDMFSYSQPGQVTGKRLRVTKTQQNLSQTQTATGDLNLTYGYNAEGKMVSIGYPTGPSYTYSFDNMMRPSGMTDQSNIAVVNNVQYGPANELLSMNMPSAGTETRTYNSMLQLTNITTSGYGGQNISYTFPSATNNGKIASQTDNLSGETVTYQYDSLNRLIQASGNGWSQSQSYDGFGNLTNRTGSMPMSTPVDPATNRLSMAGVNYDANGNMTSNGYYGYDAENRLTQINGGQTQYGYDAQNKRIWQGSFALSNGDWYLTSDTVSLFGIDGKLIGTYTPQQSQTTLSFTVVTQRVYFGSKLIGTVDSGGNLSSVVQDRLGSRGKYYPYGEERNSPQLANDQVKFATYTRDSATGLDYADQRYYASTFGRFMIPDKQGGDTEDPQSLNKYSYVGGDPVNRLDPSGQNFCSPNDIDWLFDASISGPCFWLTYPWLFLGPEFEELIATPKPSRSLILRTLRLFRDALIEATLISNIAREKALKSDVRIPTTIQLVSECWTPDFGLQSATYTLHPTYQILDQNGVPMSDGSLSGVSIAEDFSNQTGNLDATPGPPWVFGTDTGIQRNGQFTDNLSAGGLPPTFNRSGGLFQSFEAIFTIGAVPFFQPLHIQGFGPTTSILNVFMGPNDVTVNGMGIGMDPSKRCPK